MKTGLFSALERMNKVCHYHEWLFEQIGDRIDGDVIDIGSGWGDIVQFYRSAAIKSVVATDCAAQMQEILVKRFADQPQFSVQSCNILSAADIARIGEGRFDTLTSVNVLEHIADDVTALVNMRRLLKPGGRLCLIVPALKWLYGSVDRVVGHERRYSRRNILPKLAQAGFVQPQISYMNLLGTLTWFVMGRVIRRKDFPHRSSQALDRVVPFLRGMEKIIPPPFGQSLVVFAQTERAKEKS